MEDDSDCLVDFSMTLTWQSHHLPEVLLHSPRSYVRIQTASLRNWYTSVAVYEQLVLRDNTGWKIANVAHHANLGMYMHDISGLLACFLSNHEIDFFFLFVYRLDSLSVALCRMPR